VEAVADEGALGGGGDMIAAGVVGLALVRLAILSGEVQARTVLGWAV
jgi:hypothetical protein